MNKLLLLTLIFLSGSGHADAGSFRDCAACPEMLVVPAGSFDMGDARRSNARPVHRVALRRFALGRFEVTRQEWVAVMGSDPGKHGDCGASCPVENVSWEDIRSYLQHLREITGQVYRLPSEAEWEYACRAGQQAEYCSGSGLDERRPWESEEYGVLRSVADTTVNPWGLFGMSGSVWEWLEDCEHPDYIGAPADGSAWQEEECRSRVLRGGSWLSGPGSGRITLRFWFRSSFRAGDIGFRVARDLP